MAPACGVRAVCVRYAYEKKGRFTHAYCTHGAGTVLAPETYKLLVSLVKADMA